MPDVRGIRRLSLADLDDETLRDLVRHGEDLLVERKVQPPEPPKFGAAAGSFANTLGGWILLGISDDGRVEGWQPPGRADLQSYIGSVLLKQVDPLPPFVAAMRSLDDKPVGVVRIFESSDAPHIVRGSGAVYLRSAKGKQPVDDHRTLLELARRGEEAAAKAAARLVAPEGGTIASVLHARHELRPADEVRYLVRAAPITVTPAQAEWPLTRTGAETLVEVVDELLPREHHLGRGGPAHQPFADMALVTGTQRHGFGALTTVSGLADRGLIALEKLYQSGRGHPPTLLIQTLLDESIRPLTSHLLRLLGRAEAIGRSHVDFWIITGNNDGVSGGVRSRATLHATSFVTVAASDGDADHLAAAFHRQMQRDIGIVKYER